MASPTQTTLVLRPGTSQIVIDGTDIASSVQALVLHADSRSVPRLQLDLVLPDLVVNGEATVTVPDRTAHALIELGWTPPGSKKDGD